MFFRLPAAVFLFLCCVLLAPVAAVAQENNGIVLGGAASSSVVLEVFSDFQCPACRELYLNTIQPLLKNYKDKVRVVYYEFPLEMHPYSRPAARYIMATAKLGDRQKLLSLFRALFTEQNRWAEDGSLETTVAGVLSAVELQRVKQIMQDERASIDAEIEREIKLGKDKGIDGTPTMFLIRGERQEKVVIPPKIGDMYFLLTWRLNGLLE